MYSNLIIPYQTIQIHPHFEIKNDENLLIKKDNTVDLITDTYKCKKDHLDINIKINIPSNLEFFVEEHENEKKALNCSVRIESRHSVIRKSVNLIREGNQFIGDIKIDLRNYVKEIILTPEIYRTKKLNKVKTYSLAVDKGSVIGFCDRPPN